MKVTSMTVLMVMFLLPELVVVQPCLMLSGNTQRVLGVLASDAIIMGGATIFAPRMILIVLKLSLVRLPLLVWVEWRSLVGARALFCFNLRRGSCPSR